VAFAPEDGDVAWRLSSWFTGFGGGLYFHGTVDFENDGIGSAHDIDFVTSSWPLVGTFKIEGTSPVPTPEPASMLLIAFGPVGLAALRKSSKQA